MKGHETQKKRNKETSDLLKLTSRDAAPEIHKVR